MSQWNYDQEKVIMCFLIGCWAAGEPEKLRTWKTEMPSVFPHRRPVFLTQSPGGRGLPRPTGCLNDSSLAMLRTQRFYQKLFRPLPQADNFLSLFPPLSSHFASPSVQAKLPEATSHQLLLGLQSAWFGTEGLTEAPRVTLLRSRINTVRDTPLSRSKQPTVRSWSRAVTCHVCKLLD